jgi:hypothetical protein
MISSYTPMMRRQLLSSHFLMSTMPQRALDDLVKFTTVARFEPHREIFGKGDPGDCLYGILAGRVRIFSTSPEGDEILLNVLEAGELFGEIALLDGNTRTASAAAIEQADLMRIHRDHFLPYVQSQSRPAPGHADIAMQSPSLEQFDDRGHGIFAAASAARKAAVGAWRAWRALPPTGHASCHRAAVSARLGKHGGCQPRNNQQAARDMELGWDRRDCPAHDNHPQQRGAARTDWLCLMT